jgi:RNase P/RNase MRP subunit POP5
MAQERKPLSKRTRFEVFKRDGFRCVYCGATPNEGALHADHVTPVAGGGTDDVANLVTACASCNLGKSDVPLTRRAAPSMDPEAAAEHAEQLAAWVRSQQAVMEAKKQASQHMVNLWCEAIGTESCDNEVPGRLLKLLGEWPIEKLTEAIEITAGKRGLYNDSNRLRYMYGVLRRWRETAEAARLAVEEDRRARAVPVVTCSICGTTKRAQFARCGGCGEIGHPDEFRCPDCGHDRGIDPRVSGSGCPGCGRAKVKVEA